MLAVVRILGLTIGMFLGMLLVAVVMAGAGTAEFPAEVRFLEHFPILMKGEECLENGRMAEGFGCEIRVATATPGREKAIYIVITDTSGGSTEFYITSGSLVTAAVDMPRALLPDEAEVIIRGICESEELKTAAPIRCDLIAFRDNGREIFYLRLAAAAPAGILYRVFPGELIFPSSFLFFKK